MRTLSTDEAKRLITAADDTRLKALWQLGIGTGMRIGELLGLRWQDVSFSHNEIRIRHSLQRSPEGLVLSEPKTSSSVRSVYLTSRMIESLKVHRVRQTENAIRLGPSWSDLGYVFTTEVGTPINPNSIARREFRPLLKKAGIEGVVRIHDLRHTAISLALGAGVAPTDVAEMAGHSSVAVTLSRYAHALPEAPRRAAEAIEMVIA